MNIIKGNAWKLLKDYDALCVTTNGMVKKDGTQVMGRGIASQAKKRYKGIEKVHGTILKKNGLKVQQIWYDNNYDCAILAFPTKHNWYEDGDIELIENSCYELMEYIDRKRYKKVILPKPGCSNGNLDWKKVKNVIEDILDERVFVIGE